jgi:hypothetical protein
MLCADKKWKLITCLHVTQSMLSAKVLLFSSNASDGAYDVNVEGRYRLTSFGRPVYEFLTVPKSASVRTACLIRTKLHSPFNEGKRACEVRSQSAAYRNRNNTMPPSLRRRKASR